MNDVTAVGFDLGDTLCEYAGVPLDWEREYPAALAEVAVACRVELTPARLASGREVLLRFNTRRTPRPGDIEVAAEVILRELLAGWDAGQHALDVAAAAFFGHFRQTLRPFPDAPAALARLAARGIAAGVLSDVPYGMPRRFILEDVARAGLPFRDDRVLTSSDTGFRKPHPAGFAALARALGTSCGRILYVGNERKDVAGGNAAGCRTALVWRSGDAPPSWGQAFTVRSLEEVTALVCGARGR